MGSRRDWPFSVGPWVCIVWGVSHLSVKEGHPQEKQMNESSAP